MSSSIDQSYYNTNEIYHRDPFPLLDFPNANRYSNPVTNEGFDWNQSFFSSAELGTTEDTPLLEVFNSGMEFQPDFYVQIESQKYKGSSDYISSKGPRDFKRVKKEKGGEDIWFSRSYVYAVHNQCEHYSPIPSGPPPEVLRSFNKTSCSATLTLDAKGARRITLLRADPMSEDSTAVWGYASFPPDEWRLHTTLNPGLHTPEGERLGTQHLIRPDGARWTILFDDSNLFMGGTGIVAPDYTDRPGPQLFVEDQAMLWALSSLYYRPAINLSASLSQMFNNWTDGYQYPDIRELPDYPARIKVENEVMVASIYWKEEQQANIGQGYFD